MANVVCFGEVLWDVFPNHKKIGGAPLNVALRLHSFGHNVAMISAVGNDENGDKLLEHIAENGLETNLIQVSKQFKTSEVLVKLNEKGSATYEIVHPRAWDKIESNKVSRLAVATSDAFVFGSLITRDDTSRRTLFDLIDLAAYRVFDLNLRPPHYSNSVLIDLMKKADFIKFNDEELYEVGEILGSKYSNLEQNIRFISSETNTKHICVTKGEHGAVLLYEDKLY